MGLSHEDGDGVEGKNGSSSAAVDEGEEVLDNTADGEEFNLLVELMAIELLLLCSADAKGSSRLPDAGGLGRFVPCLLLLLLLFSFFAPSLFSIMRSSAPSSQSISPSLTHSIEMQEPS